MYTHVIEAIALLVVVVMAADGWRKGLILKLFGLVRFIVMIVLTIVLTPILYKVLPMEEGMKAGAAVLLALVLSVVGIILLSKVLKIVDHIPVVKTVNHIGGMLVGLLFGLLTVWVALLLINAFRNVEWCRTVIYHVKQSPVLFWLLHFDPVAFLGEI